MAYVSPDAVLAGNKPSKSSKSSAGHAAAAAAAAAVGAAAAAQAASAATTGNYSPTAYQQSHYGATPSTTKATRRRRQRVRATRSTPKTKPLSKTLDQTAKRVAREVATKAVKAKVPKPVAVKATAKAIETMDAATMKVKPLKVVQAKAVTRKPVTAAAERPVPKAPKVPGPRKVKVRQKLKQAVKQAKPQIPPELASLGPHAKKLAKADIRLSKKQDIPASVLFNQQGIESGWGANTGPSSAGAMGDTQFMPATRDQVLAEHGVDAYGKPKEAAKAQALYLNDVVKAQGGSGFKDDPHAAVYGYNHSEDYVNDVLGGASKYKALDKVQPKQIPQKVVRKAEKVLGPKQTAKVIDKATSPEPTESKVNVGKLRGPKPQIQQFKKIVQVAQRIDASNKPYVWGGGHVAGKIPGIGKASGYDCSGFTSKVLQAAGVPGLEAGGITSGQFGSVEGLEPGPGAVSIFYNSGHVFMRIGDKYYGTSSSGAPDGGSTGTGGLMTEEAGASQVESGAFNVVHVASLDGLKGAKVATKGLKAAPNGTFEITDSAPVGAPGATDLPPTPFSKLSPKQKQQVNRAAGVRPPQRGSSTKSYYSLDANPSTDPSDYEADQFLERLAALT